MVVKKEYQINSHLTLKLEDTQPDSYRDWTVIYVDEEEFLHCHFLFITLSEENFEDCS